MFSRWNRCERIYCILACVWLLILVPMGFLFVFIIPLPHHIGLWIFRIGMLLIPVFMGLADWRTDRKSSYFEFGTAGSILLGIILSGIFCTVQTVS